MRTRWVTTVLGLVIALSLMAAYTAFAATGSKPAPSAASCGTCEGKGQAQMMGNLTPEQRGQMEALREKMGNLTPEQREQLQSQCDKIRGEAGETAAPSAGTGATTGQDI